MEKKGYEKVLLFCGVMSAIGFPDGIKAELESNFGEVSICTEPFLFDDFTSYYEKEMGKGIRRFFIAFGTLVDEDYLKIAKTITNEIEKKYSENGKRKINLDPGTISTSNLILATTKNRAHRIPIGDDLYAEVTLIYHKKGWESFSWTYSDYKNHKVQDEMSLFRTFYLERTKAEKNKKTDI